MNAVTEPREAVPMGLVPGPFHDRLEALNHQRAWMNWMGVASPAVLDTVEFEYFAIRNQATLFDVSPMMKYRIAGPDAEAVANRLVTRDVTKLRPGRVAYVIWCDEAGNVVDDGTLFRLSATEFRLCCQEPQLAWLDDVAWGFDVTVEDVSRDIAGLALQGPTSCAVLRDAGLAGIEAMKPFDLREFRVDAHAVTVSRTGFTGDLGYELWMAPEDALAVWDRDAPAAGARAQSLRAWPRLAGGARQTPFQRPPGVAAACEGKAPAQAGGDRDRPRQARPPRARLPCEAPRGRIRHLRALVADAEAQHRPRLGRGALRRSG